MRSKISQWFKKALYLFSAPAALLVLIMLSGLIPAAAFTAGDVAEVWRGGALVGSYDNLDDALIALQGEYDENDEWVGGGTLKLLGDIDYDGQIMLFGEVDDPTGVVIDLGGHTLNVIHESTWQHDYALQLEWINLTLTNIGGGAFNIALIPATEPHIAARIKNSTATVSSIAVTNAIEGEFVALDARKSAVSVLGNLTAPGKWSRAVEIAGDSGGGDTSQVTVAGNIYGAARVNGGNLTVSGSLFGDAEAANIGSHILVLGSITNNVSIFPALSVRDGASAEIRGNVTEASGNEESCAVSVGADGTVTILGYVISETGPGILVFDKSHTVIDGTVAGDPYILFYEEGDAVDERKQGEYDRNSGTGYFIYEYGYAPGEIGDVWIKDAAAGDVAGIYNMQLSNAVATKAYYDPGDVMNISLYGEAGGTARAVITYDDPALGLTGATQNVVLTESAEPGLYKGAFLMAEGISAVKGAVFSLDGIPGKTREEISLSANRLPEIRGALLVNIINQYPGARIAGQLMATNGRGGNSVNVGFTEPQADISLPGLPAGTGYTLKLYDPAGSLAGELSGITVAAGQTAAASITPEFKPTLSVSFTFGNDIEKYLWQVLPVLVRDAVTKVAVGTIYLGTTYFDGFSGTLSGLTIGREYEISFRGGGKTGYDENGELVWFYYPDAITRTITAVPGENTVVFHMTDYAIKNDATLEGRVTFKDNGTPVKGVTVSVSQNLANIGINRTEYFNVKADDSGNYSLPVFAGCPATVSVLSDSRYIFEYEPPISLTTVAGRNTRDFICAGGTLLKADIRVFVKYFGETVFHEIGGTTPESSEITLTNLKTQKTKEYVDRLDWNYHGKHPVSLGVQPGDQIHMKLKVTRPGANFIPSLELPEAEYILEVGDDCSIRKDVYLVQTGGLLNFRLVDRNGEVFRVRYSTYSSWLYGDKTAISVLVKDTQSNNAVNYKYSNLYGDTYQIYFEKPGVYEVTFKSVDYSYVQSSAGSGIGPQSQPIYTAKRTITVYEGTETDYGNVVLDPDHGSGGYATGSVTASPSTSVPGGTVTVTANYQRESKPRTAEEYITLEVPAGTTFMPGSLTKNSVSLPDPAVNNITGGFNVPITETDPESGFIAFRVIVDTDVDECHIHTSAVYHAGGGIDTLGTAEITVETLTMDVPAYTSRRDVTLRGLAPASSVVKVYDRGVPLGEAVASGAGTWFMPLILPGTDGVNRRYELTATAEYGGGSLYLNRQIMVYNPLYPQLTTMTVYSADHAPRQMDVTGGQVSFPYKTLTWMFTKPQGMTVSARFSNSAAVKNVRIFITGDNGVTTGERAVYDPKTGLFNAFIIDALSILGVYEDGGGGNGAFIYAEYDVIEENLIHDFSLPPNMEDLRYLLPGEADGAMLEDTEVLAGEEPEPDEFELDPDEDGEYEIEPGTTTTIKGDLKNFYGTDGSITITISELSYYTPPVSLNNYYTAGGWSASNYHVNMSETASQIIITGSVIVRQPTRGPSIGGMFKVGWKIVTNGKSLYNAISSSGDWDSLNDMLNMLDDDCIPDYRKDTYRDLIDKKMKDYTAATASSAALTIGGLFAGPLSPLVSGAGLLLDYGASKSLERFKDKLEKWIAEDIANNEDCDKDPDPDNPPGPNKPPNPKKPKKPGVRPLWIHDPSGVIYEVTMDEPIEGATATLLFEVGSDTGKGTGEWVVFDMEWYEQVNPYITQSGGWYAWDVPKGNWMVMYEKEGYKTEFSPAMEVPPIRLDVHQALESLSPPQVTGAYYTAPFGGIDIVFDKYVKVSDVNGGNVSVYTAALAEDGTPLGGNEFLTGTFEPVDPVEYKGETVAKAFKFISDEPMKLLKEYKVGFMPAVRSYAGIPLAAALSVTATAPPPVPVKGLALEQTHYFLKVTDAPLQAVPMIKPANAANQKVSWTSSNTDVARVAADGTITPVGVGVCYVTAATEDGGFEAYANVYVTSEVTGVTLDTNAITLAVGESRKLTATVQPENASNKAVRWSTCNTEYITVTQNGLVTAHKEGMCVVTVTTQDGGKTAQCLVMITAAPQQLLGDVSGDGAIDMQDVLLIYQHFRGKITLTADEFLRADVNVDGNITMQDVLLVYQYFRGKIIDFAP